MIVCLVQPLDMRNGPHFNPGECVCLDDALAQDLIDRGIARRQEDAMPIPAAKIFTAPPADKHVTSPKGKKGWVRA